MELSEGFSEDETHTAQVGVFPPTQKEDMDIPNMGNGVHPSPKTQTGIKK